MGAELSTDYDERTVIAKARVTMGWFAGMLIAAGAFAFIFQPDGEADGRLVADNYLTYGIVAATLSGVTALICVLGTRSVIDRLPTASESQQHFGLGTIFSDLRIALGNYNFRITVIANLAFGMAAGVYTTINLYMGTYFWEFSSDQLAALVAPTLLATLFAFAALNRLGRRFDKPQLMCAAALCLALNSMWMIGARLLDLLPDNSHASIYLLQVANTVIAVFVIVALQVLGVSLTADVLDEQELHTGKRQEGVFFAASNFIGKATTGFGALIAGLIVELSGIAPGSEPGTVAEPVLNIMGGLTMAIIFALTFSAFLVFRRIRLSRADHARIRARLATAGTDPQVIDNDRGIASDTV
jgi:Na+/melibiose symporter-like transporter